MLLLTKEKLKEILINYKTKSYVYGLCRNNKELYYVGIGKGNRVFYHETESKNPNQKGRNNLKLNITRKEIENGGLFYVLFGVYNNRDDCLEIEQSLINYFGRVDLGSGILSNMTDGGEGVPTNAVISNETKLKQQEARLRNKSIMSEKAKLRWSLKTPEERQLLCKHLTTTKSSEKYRQAVSQSKKLAWKNSTDEYKNRVLENLALQRLTNIYRENHSLAMQKLWKEEHFKQRRLEANRTRFADPEYRKKMSDLHRVSQLRVADAQSKRVKATMADPIKKAAILAKTRATLASKSDEEKAATYKRRSEAQLKCAQDRKNKRLAEEGRSIETQNGDSV